MAVANTSWRCQLDASGVLACPKELTKPWLFTLDPMTYKADGYADDNNLYRADIDRLCGILKHFASSRQPGVMAVFVYAIRPEGRESFWGFVDNLATRAGLSATCCWHTHQGGNRNLAGLIHSDFEPSVGFPPKGITLGRD